MNNLNEVKEQTHAYTDTLISYLDLFALEEKVEVKSSSSDSEDITIAVACELITVTFQMLQDG